MSIVNQPDDILGLALKNLLTPLLADEKIVKTIKKLNRVIIMELVDIYAITLTFNTGNIRIELGEKKPYHLKLIVTLDTFTGIAEGKIGLIGAFLKRKIKVKKIYRLFTILKFRKIFFPAIKAAAQTPALEGVINIL